jgi:uncharacterized radical SAM protein YgiQ
MVIPFLPTTQAEAKDRGWDGLDVVLVTGDAYVDHPSYGTAVIGRVLEAAGFRVGVIAQPDLKTTHDLIRFGRPRLFFGITAGNMDSMVANYTAHKRPRLSDDYSPGGRPGLRPDHAVIVYANKVREAFKDVPIVIGGIEASLRRFAHYDWWKNEVRRSILLDSRADILVYGMGEAQVVEIARRLGEGRTLHGIRGTAVVTALGRTTSQVPSRRSQETGTDLGPVVEMPSYEEVRGDIDRFNEAFRIVVENQDPFTGRTLAQGHANRYVVQYPPALPLETKDLDGIYELPYARAWHPSYGGQGGVPGFETVRFSIISHRGCPGECSFCGLALHQGRIVSSRSESSILKEAEALTRRRDFRGTITDVGGPTANLYGAVCDRWQGKGACGTRHCLTPTPCRNLNPDTGKAFPSMESFAPCRVSNTSSSKAASVMTFLSTEGPGLSRKDMQGPSERPHEGCAGAFFRQGPRYHEQTTLFGIRKVLGPLPVDMQEAGEGPAPRQLFHQRPPRLYTR